MKQDPSPNRGPPGVSPTSARSVVTAFFCAFLAACGEAAPPDEPTPIEATVNAVLSWAPSNPTPGSNLTVQVNASASAGAVQWAVIDISGLVSLHDSVPWPRPSSVGVHWSVTLPYDPPGGQVRITALVGVEHGPAIDTAQATVAVADRLPPTIDNLRADPYLAIGATYNVWFHAADSVGIERVIVSTVAIGQADTVELGRLTEYDAALSFPLPGDVDLIGVETPIRVEAVDIAGNRAVAQTVPSRFDDLAEPEVLAEVVDPRPYVRKGDSLEVRVRIADNTQIRSISWFRGGVEYPNTAGIIQTTDSWSVSGSSIDTTIYVPVADLVSMWLRVYATDAGNNTGGTERLEYNTVIGVVPANETEVDVMSVITDARADSDRDRLYLTTDAPNVVVVLPGTGQITGSVGLPSTASGIDFTPAGDSLIAVLPETQQLAVIDAATLTLLSLIDVPLLPGGTTPVDIAIMGQGRVFLTVDAAGGTGRIIDFEFSDLSATDRTQEFAAPVTEVLAAIRTADRSEMLVATAYAVARYVLADDEFTAVRATGWVSRHLAAASDGRLYMVGRQVFLRTLEPINTPTDVPLYSGSVAFIPDATFHYFATDYGYTLAHQGHLATEQRFELASPPTDILITPDGEYLIGYRGSMLSIVGL